MNYHNYKAIDFATDDAFILWVLEPDAQSNQTWEAWLQEHPEKKAEVMQARALILSIRPEKFSWSRDRQQAIKDQILAQINKPSEGGETRSFPIRKLLRIAASIGLILFCAGAWILWKYKPLHYHTDFGVTQEVHLPDGSLVILNANSSLVYQKNFWTGTRNANLSGEAFFQVQKTADSAHFIVKSSNIITEVLGTEFSIRTRRDTTQVVLSSGSIRLHAEEDATHSDMGLTLSPGELVEYAQKDVIRKEVVDTKLYEGLRNNMLIFNKTPLREVAKQVLDLYGYTLEFPQGVERESFTANLPLSMDGIELLEMLLSESFRLQVSSKTDSVLVFKQSAT